MWYVFDAAAVAWRGRCDTFEGKYEIYLGLQHWTWQHNADVLTGDVGRLYLTRNSKPKTRTSRKVNCFADTYPEHVMVEAWVGNFDKRSEWWHLHPNTRKGIIVCKLACI